MWQKKGLVYKPDGSLWFSRSHAQVPFAFPKDDFLRIYFSTRDDKGQSRPTFIDVDYEDPTKVLYVHYAPVLELGGPSEYDETGAMPSWFVPQPNGELWLYYTGWNRTWNAYRLSVGLAVSTDGGISFTKKFTGPVMDRSIYNPIWAAQPSVMIEDGVWKMWYIAAQYSKYINDFPEPFYRCQYAESQDGIHWQPTGDVVLEFDEFLNAVGRPSVYKEDGIYKMIYSYRNAVDYRINRDKSYRIGYAESKNGKQWERKDHLAGIAKSEDPSEWDYQMINYCHTYCYKGKRYLLYNGNGFGASGFGYAIWE